MLRSLCQISKSSPMKKKTKMDPNIAIQKELKKKRKIEKAIRQIEKKGRMLKPIDEIEGDRMLLKTIDTRKREPTALTFEESERRALLYKEWSRYKRYQHIVEMQQLTKAVAAQEKALQALKEESEELYKQAIQLDDNLPYTWTGPSFTPAIPDYDAPDGDYKDTTKTFDDLPIGPLFQKKNTRRR